MSNSRLFTLEDAERTLPLVRGIVADLVKEYPDWRAGVSRYEALTLAARADSGETAEMQAVLDDVNARAARIDGYLKELESIGCVFKGFDAGLVDFPSLRDDQPILLCWRLGEERITHWHPVDGGFEGRQPVDDAILSEVAR
ncbi:MAG TPA: DUF2203 domain-containing protein [Gemmatimonadales bacterium]|nr:DUF2203 domain-containing protein [Gemmatimonadales bacterium]